MDLKSVGLIVIGIILLAIIAAFIFNSKFRKDVIASEGEAAVLGLINVKGVIIVLMTAIFGGIFVYIIQLENDAPKALTQEEALSRAIALLAKEEGESYEIKKEADSLRILVEGKEIGTLPAPLEPIKQLSAAKSKGADNFKWDVRLNEKTLGFVKTDYKTNFIEYRPPTNKRLGDQYNFEEKYRVNMDLDLYFAIDTYYEKNDYYLIKFGEGKKGNINWQDTPEKFKRNDFGKIDLKDGYKYLHNPDWENDYYVGLGVGYPGYDTLRNKPIHVEKLNMVVLKSRLE